MRYFNNNHNNLNNHNNPNKCQIVFKLLTVKIKVLSKNMVKFILFNNKTKCKNHNKN